MGAAAPLARARFLLHLDALGEHPLDQGLLLQLLVLAGLKHGLCLSHGAPTPRSTTVLGLLVD